MAISAQLRLRQTQSLALTPQLIQSIRLLQMTTAELEYFIDAELENNPLLERAETEKASEDAFPAPETAGPEKNISGDDDIAAIADAMADIYGSALENIYPDDPVRKSDMDFTLGGHRPLAAGRSYPENVDIALLVAEKPTMRDHLHEQIVFAFRGSVECAIAADLAEQIDDAGYFTGSLEETSRRLGVACAVVKRVFSRLQNFEPAGIFARDLSECLALQLERRGRLTPVMKILLKNLPVLAKRDFDTLARLCGTGRQDVMNMLEEIRFLDPKPAAIWSTTVAGAVVPDAFVTENRDGTFHVELNNAVLPSLVVNHSYSLDICADTAEREFFSSCQQHANWLLRALDQRARTFLKVISEIVKYQQAFLQKGVVALRPLSRAMIAEAVGMHESTISRVISHKYLATPRGMFALRSFFSTGLGAVGDKTHCPSTDAVRFHIRNMIAGETADDILSDDAIVERLRAEGIDIARRTVAKYRESMNIASSIIRKRLRKHENNNFKLKYRD